MLPRAGHVRVIAKGEHGTANPVQQSGRGVGIRIIRVAHGNVARADEDLRQRRRNRHQRIRRRRIDLRCRRRAGEGLAIKYYLGFRGWADRGLATTLNANQADNENGDTYLHREHAFP